MNGVEVRRWEDDELLGYVEQVADPDSSTRDRWRSLTIFGGLLGESRTRADAVEHVESVGLSVLAETWWYRADASTRWRPALILEARPDEVRARVGTLPEPIETVTIRRPGPDTLRLVEPRED